MEHWSEECLSELLHIRLKWLTAAEVDPEGADSWKPSANCTLYMHSVTLKEDHVYPRGGKNSLKEILPSFFIFIYNQTDKKLS